MRSFASPNFPFFLCIAVLFAGIGTHLLSPLQTMGRDRSPPLASLLAPVMADRMASMQNQVAAELQNVWSQTPAVLGTRTEDFIMRRGDTLIDVLTRAGLDRSTASSVVAAVHTIYNPKRLHAGQDLELSYNPLATAAEEPFQLAFDTTPGHRLAVERQSDGVYAARDVLLVTHREALRVEGTINTSLFDAAEQQAIPAEVLAEMVRLFSYDVDFQRDLQKGDHFALLYDRDVDADGRAVRNAGIRYASMTVGGALLKFYAFNGEDGTVQYYNEKGLGIRKALMRTPINGATLTSGFGMRKHPILGYTRMHRGVDFGAPIGTPIMAAGDGVVDKREYSRGYGNYLRLRHGSGYWTAYAHMSRYATGMSEGRHVHQGEIIGYVGQTGLATGPHLHFEVLRDMEQVNPITVKFPAAEKLEGAVLARFKTARAALDQEFAALGAASQVAKADTITP